MGKYSLRNEVGYKRLCIFIVCSMLIASTYLKFTANYRIILELEQNGLVTKYSQMPSKVQMKLGEYLPDIIMNKFKKYNVYLTVNQNTDFRNEIESIEKLSTLDFHDRDLNLLEKILRNNPQLNDLVIANILTRDVLPLIIQHCPNLESLNLLDINESDKELIYSLKSLKYLYVESDTYIENKNLSISEQLLLREPEAFPHFDFLDFTNAQDLPDETLSRLIRSRKSFSRIYLPGRFIGDRTTEALLTNTFLKNLNPARCTCSWRGVIIDGAISKQNGEKIYDSGIRTLRLDYDQEDNIYYDRNPEELVKKLQREKTESTTLKKKGYAVLEEEGLILID
ncbi:MAG: hypothetical protein NE330_04075 [Lentisphaeraceae bacterium]|nr:hypothetical protein [Lentisphaeraceae bacterium]